VNTVDTSKASPGVPASLIAPVLIALTLLVLLPISFVALQAIFPALNEGSFAHPFSAFGAVLRLPSNWVLLGRTLGFGLSVALCSLALGLPLGVVRGLFVLPMARVWDLIFLGPLLIPPYLCAFAWMLLLQPNGYLQQMVGFNLGAQLFSFGGVVLVMALSLFPIVYFSVSRALLAMGNRHAEVARIFGAGPWRAFFKITLPLILPSIAASTLLTFTMAIEEFGIPAALGSRAGVNLLVTAIESRFSDWPIDLPGAAVLSLLLAGLAMIAFIVQKRLLASSSVETQTGKPALTIRPTLSGQHRSIALAACVSLGLCATGAPLFAIFTTACLHTVSGGFARANATVSHFAALFAGGDGAQALLTSLGLAAGTAIVTAVLGFLSAFFVVRTHVRGRGAVDGLSMLPHALPGMVVGVGLILAWNLPFWPVTPYNTWGILLLSYSCLLLPYPIRYTTAALRQIGPSQEAAARVHGATMQRTLWRIVLPMSLPALAWSMLIVFAIASRELVTSLLLAPSGLQTTSIYIWNQFEQGSVGDGMAMGSVMIVISATLLAVGARCIGRFD